MKTLTTVSRTACLLAALSGCGTDPILLGEILGAAEQGSNTPTPADDQPVPTTEPETPTAAEPEPETGDPAPAPPPGYPEADDTEAQVLSLLDQYCSECHGGPDPLSDFVAIEDVDAMIDEGTIVPGDRDQSRIYVRMAARTMPPFTGLPQPTFDEIDFIGQFIDDLDP